MHFEAIWDFLSQWNTDLPGDKFVFLNSLLPVSLEICDFFNLFIYFFGFWLLGNAENNILFPELWANNPFPSSRHTPTNIMHIKRSNKRSDVMSRWTQSWLTYSSHPLTGRGLNTLNMCMYSPDVDPDLYMMFVDRWREHIGIEEVTQIWAVLSCSGKNCTSLVSFTRLVLYV